MTDIKGKVLSLFNDYESAKDEKPEGKQGKRVECVDKLFILVYYNPRFFGLNMPEDMRSDFLSQLYPCFFENLFKKYDATKSSFYTFVNVCIKYQINFFLRKKLSDTMNESALLQQLQLEHSGFEESEAEEVEGNECLGKIKVNAHYEVESEQMKKELQIWISDKTMSAKEKYRKRAIFILLCKTASFLDDQILSKINSYLKMPTSLLYYYMERFAEEFVNCNKGVENAGYRRSKYLIRYLHTAHLLQMDGKTEYEQDILKKRLNFSHKHYMNASNFIKNKLKSVSNRSIAMITGFSRSCVDRVCLNAKDLFEDIRTKDLRMDELS